MASQNPDLGKMKKDLHSLDPDEYIRFMKEVHFECPFKTMELTDEIVNHWKNDHSMKTEKFQEIIKEREAEHKETAQQKRQQNLICIQDRKSRTGLDPLQLFPKEIWLMLLDQLPPQDKLNFRAVHKTFQDLTNDSFAGDILLPLTVGFKVERFWGHPFHPQLVGLISQKPQFCPLAQFSELRLVSKSLRNAVDKWHEDFLISKLRCGRKNVRPSVVTSISLQNLEDCQKFRRMKTDLENNPKLQRFYTRSLEIVSPRESRSNFHLDLAQRAVINEQFSDFNGNINDILGHIGDQIWYFSFDFSHPSDENEPLFAERYTSFLGWLGKMPQLKWLKVTINQSEKDSRYGFRLPEGSLPVLGDLERLDLELKQKNRYILPVFKNILSAYSHVKILNLRGLKCLLKKKYGFVVGQEDSPLKLEALIMDGSTTDYPTYSSYDDEDGSSDDDNFEYDEQDENFRDPDLFQSIIQTSSNWPLRQIDWKLQMGNMYVDGIFQWLGTVKTLEKVRLSLDDVAIRHKAAYLELPNLTHFELKLKKSVSFDDDKCKTCWSFLFSLQFLLFAKKLKVLVWKCDMEERGWNKLNKDLLDIQEIGDILDFDWVALNLLGFVEEDGDIAESNIWRMFRSLDTVVVALSVLNGSRVEKSVSERFVRREIDFSKRKSWECASSSSSSESEVVP